MGIRLRSPYVLLGTLDSDASAYVMPEWFGAEADGVTDDSDAFVQAMTDGRPIGLAGNKTYALKNVVIPVDSSCPGIFSPAGQARIVPPSVYVKGDSFFLVNKPDGFAFDGLFFDMPLNLEPFTDYRFNKAIWLAPDSTASRRGRNYRVENCAFSGGATAMSGVGYIIEDSRFTNNHVSGTLGDSFSFNAVINVDIDDNVFEDCAVTTTGLSSGVIRTGTDTQLDSSLNLSISGNVITRSSVASSQSAIDCFSGAARNIRITDNILSYNGAGIELKTMIWDAPDPLPPGATDAYEHNVIANNTIRLFTGVSTSAITVFHANPGAPKGKAANVNIAGNIISSTGDVIVGAISHYAIAVSGHDNVVIDSNQILNVGHGISIAGDGPAGNVADNITISNNTVDVAEVAITNSGGTLNHVYIRNNPLLRNGALANGPAVILSCPGTDIEISGNRIENLAPGVHAFEVRELSDVRVTDNTIIANGAAVVMQGTAASKVKFRDNEIVSATSYGFNLGIGTEIEVSDNTVEVPLDFVVVGGAASYKAANNVRGLMAANPTGTAAGSLGDIFLDSTAATAGWRCTAAGSIAGAIWTAI